MSGLIFPGVGHLYLKRYAHGIMLFAGAASAIYYLVTVVVTTALEVVKKIQSSGTQADMSVITDLVSQQSSGAEQATNVAMIAFVVFWVMGVADSYRQGRADERVAMAAGEQEA